MVRGLWVSLPTSFSDSTSIYLILATLPFEKPSPSRCQQCSGGIVPSATCCHSATFVDFGQRLTNIATMSQVNKAASLAYVDTDLSADCIEFCPFEGYQEFFICGTYQVLAPEATPKTVDDESDDEAGPSSSAGPTQTRRTGRLLLFRVSADEQTV